MRRKEIVKCKLDCCDSYASTRGYCKNHYRQFNRQLNEGIKEEDIILKPIKYKGEVPVCNVMDCDKLASLNKLCIEHYNEKKVRNKHSLNGCKIY